MLRVLSICPSYPGGFTGVGQVVLLAYISNGRHEDTVQVA